MKAGSGMMGKLLQRGRRMKHPLVYLLPVVGLVSGPATAADLPNLEEGLWEITTTREISGPVKKQQEYTLKHCITKKDIEQGKGRMHQPGMHRKDCQVKNYKVEANRASWNLVCTGDNPVVGTGSVTYSGTSFDGTNKTTIGKKGQEKEVTETFSGKRLGPCPQ